MSRLQWLLQVAISQAVTLRLWCEIPVVPVTEPPVIRGMVIVPFEYGNPR